MATFKSNLIKKKHIHRSIYDGKEYTATGILRFPAAGTLALNDVLLAVPVGENQLIKRVEVSSFGVTTAEASIGYVQKLGRDGNPLVVRRKGPSAYAPNDETFVSPATSASALGAAAVLSTPREVFPAASKLAGPVDVALTITTAGTVAAGAEVHVTVFIEGEHSNSELTVEYPPRTDYLA